MSEGRHFDVEEQPRINEAQAERMSALANVNPGDLPTITGFRRYESFDALEINYGSESTILDEDGGDIV